VAEIVTGVLTATTAVVMVKAGDVSAPAATVTVAGTTAAALLLVSVTTAPPVGARLVRVTVLAVVEIPPKTEVGFSATEAAAGGVVLLLTVIEIPALVLELLAESVATAVRVCGPLLAVVLSQFML
jgi:hypothetical protein